LTLSVPHRTGTSALPHAAFVPAGAEHRFVAYEHLSLLVIFERSTR